MSRHDSVTAANRRRQFLREQRQFQAHGMPNWFDNHSKRHPPLKISRHQRLANRQRRRAVYEIVHQNAIQGNSQWLILPKQNGQAVRPAPIPSVSASVPPASEPATPAHGTARPLGAETCPAPA